MTRRLIFPLLLGAGGIAVLCALGTWQLQRLHWKQGILTVIDARISGVPIEIPRSPGRKSDNYLSVVAAGEILPGELFVLFSREGFGPGFRIIAPFDIGGRQILLDRGFIPEQQRWQIREIGAFQIRGNLHWPDETDRFFTPQPEGDLWFAREVDAMANYFGTEPILLVAKDVLPEIDGIYPWPIDSSGIPNNHLNYATTWFLLAAAWLAMTAMWIWRINQSESQ